MAASKHYRTMFHRSVFTVGWKPKLTRRLKQLVSPNSYDDPAPDGGNMIISGRSGARKNAARQRLADSLRANLSRRKAQQREQKKQQAAHLSNTATVDAGPHETLSSQALPPRE